MVLMRCGAGWPRRRQARCRRYEAGAVAEDQRQHVGRRGTKRHADTDFRHPLHDELGEHAVDADDGQDQPRTENSPIRRSTNSLGAIASSIRRCSGRTPENGCSRSIDRMMSRIAGTSASGSPVNSDQHAFGQEVPRLIAQLINHWAGSCSSVMPRMSAMTPTTRISCVFPTQQGLADRVGAIPERAAAADS